MTGSDIARNKLKQSRYEDQAEEKKGGNSVYSDAAESEVESVKRVVRSLGKDLKKGKKKPQKKSKVKTKNIAPRQRKRIKSKQNTETVRTSSSALKPKTADKQKRQLTIRRAKDAKATRVSLGKKKLQIKQTIGARKELQKSIKVANTRQSSSYQKTELSYSQQKSISNGNGKSISPGREKKENPLTAKQKKNIPKKRKKNAKPKTKNILGKPKTKKRLGMKSPISKENKIKKTKAKKKVEQQMRNRATQVAIKAGKLAVKIAKQTIILIIKAAKALVSAMAALVGGSSLVAVLLIVAVVAAIVASPFGLFYSGEDKTPEVEPITGVVRKIDGEFDKKIEQIKDANSYVDRVAIDYIGNDNGVKTNNWLDVITIFAINTTMGKEEQMDVATIDTKRVGLIRKTFNDMNLVEYKVEEEDETDEDGEVTGSETVLTITVTSYSAWDMAGVDKLNFGSSQLEVLEEMMNGELRVELMKLLGLNFEGLTPRRNRRNSLQSTRGRRRLCCCTTSYDKARRPLQHPLTWTGKLYRL